ncbi:hypothetical protein CF160_01450 [Enterococcus pseudoavium]|nr:hypothetical protein CF160_01450 [Enterococcus pseudoavium]
MKTYPLPYLISYARENSPFYRELYRELPAKADFSQLPLIDQTSFWQEPRAVLSYVPNDGHVFRSGGTTGKPKLTYYAEEEWQTMCESTAFMMPQSNLQYGDRVVNLFYSGNMYASFLYCYSLFRLSPVKVQQFDVSGQVAIDVIADLILENQINVIAGLPSMIIKVLAYARKKTMTILLLRRFIMPVNHCFQIRWKRFVSIYQRLIFVRSHMRQMMAGSSAFLIKAVN